MENISKETLEFVSLFKPLISGEIIPWVGNDAVGLSILREYPEKGKFIPAKNKLGKNDSVALIKIGYLKRTQTDEKQLHRELTVSVSKASRFLLKGNFDFNFSEENEDSPDEASLKESKSSKQPIDLVENDRYQYNISTKSIKDLLKNKLISPDEIVNEIYNIHLRTLSYSAFLFRMKIWFQLKTLNYVGPMNEGLKRLNFWLFGRSMRKSENFGLGIFDTYAMSDLIDSTTEKTKIFGSDLPITNQSARTFIIVVLSLFIINHFFAIDFLDFVKISDEAAKNSLFQFSFIGGLLFLFDKIFPYSILFLINFFIKLSVWLMKRKFKFT